MHTTTPFHRRLVIAAAGAMLGATLGLVQAAEGDHPALGRWALTIPGGGAGWLGLTQERGYYDGAILWGGGSVVPVDSVFFADDTVYVTRVSEVKRRDAAGKVVRTQRFTELLSGRVQGDQIYLTRMLGRENGRGIIQEEFTGRRIPPLPAKPDLAKLKFEDAIVLFNGRDLTGWRLTSPNQVNGWRVQDGLLINRPDQEEGQPHKSYGNLRTDREFSDFNLKLEARVPKNGNSGIYLRGIYEVQVADTYGKGLDSHNMGGVYSRITPKLSAEKPAGEWQTYDITLADRHITVVLNGKTIIDNEPLLGCTGGALWSDEARPGPLYLQGDHTGVDYRHIVLRPVVK